MQIITHRGLDCEKHHSFTESSKEAFQFFLDAGFGLEFDVQITKDGIPVISHDTSLTRLSGIKMSPINEQTTEEFLNTALPNGTTLTLDTLIEMMLDANAKTASVHALHLKANNQSDEQLSVLLPYLKKLGGLSLMIFDVKPEVARKIKTTLPSLSLAASVAHPFDIKRYNDAVGDTLVSIEDMATHTDIYDWAWLDEWDRVNTDDTSKALYTDETFDYLRQLNYKLAVVSPELHATSPKLLGSESHPDAINFETLRKRWHEISTLHPDAICTDYPHTIAKMYALT